MPTRIKLGIKLAPIRSEDISWEERGNVHGEAEVGIAGRFQVAAAGVFKCHCCSLMVIQIPEASFTYGPTPYTPYPYITEVGGVCKLCLYGTETITTSYSVSYGVVY